MSGIVTAEPAHVLKLCAELYRRLARAHRDAGATWVHVDTLEAIAAALDKESGR